MEYYGINEPTLFACVNDLQTQQFLSSAHNSITRSNLWSWMAETEPENGFMFHTSSEMELLKEEMKKDEINACHSGASYAYILREMQYIARNGYEQYICEYIKNQL
jgi:hypothetical protein